MMRQQKGGLFMENTMKASMQTEQPELSSSHSLANLCRGAKRNLGCGILVAAVEDYLGLDEQAHASAARFLFPSEPEYREHYDWVVSMATGVNAAWLREALDQARMVWDQRRLNKKLDEALAHRLQARLSA